MENVRVRLSLDDRILDKIRTKYRLFESVYIYTHTDS